MHKDPLEEEKEFSFKSLFIPLTTFKAIHIIVIVGFLVFGNMLFNGFAIDDYEYIINDPVVHQFNIAQSFGPNHFNNAGQYRPIPHTYFSFLYVLFQEVPFFYHLIQLTLHILCTILLYNLSRKFFSSKISLFISLVFLVHPIQVESVSYIAQTVSPLFTLFGMLALLIATKKHISIKALISICFLLFIALLTKETGILFFIVVLLYSFLFARKYLLRLSIGLVATFILYVVFRLLIGQVGIVVARTLVPIADLPLSDRLLNVPMIFLHYLKTFFFPKDLAVLQQWVITSPDFLTFYIPVFITLLVLFCLLAAGYIIFLRFRQHIKVYIFFSVWFFVGLFMHLNIVPLDFTVADRFFYFPLIGLTAIFVLIYQDILKPLGSLKQLSIFLSIVIILTLSLRTIARNNDWYDNLTLYTRDLRISDNYLINAMVAVSYSDIKNHEKALQHLKKSVALRPNETALYNLGVTYQNMGDMQNAKESYYRALTVKNYYTVPQHDHALRTYIRYAASHMSDDNMQNVIRILDAAILDYPESSGLRILHALSKYKNNDKQGALEAIGEAYKRRNDKEVEYIYSLITSNSPIHIELVGFPINIDKP